MADRFRIHGDNIVECERIADIILSETQPTSITVSLMSPSTIVYNLLFNYIGHCFSWQLELLPGFNKAGRSRWESDMFTATPLYNRIKHRCPPLHHLLLLEYRLDSIPNIHTIE